MSQIMKVVAAVGLGALLSAGSAMAAVQHEAVGRIQHDNPKGNRLMVSPQIYSYNPRLLSQLLTRGETVRVIYRPGHGGRIVEKINPA